MKSRVMDKFFLSLSLFAYLLPSNVCGEDLTHGIAINQGISFSILPRPKVDEKNCRFIEIFMPKELEKVKGIEHVDIEYHLVESTSDKVFSVSSFFIFPYDDGYWARACLPIDSDSYNMHIIFRLRGKDQGFSPYFLVINNFPVWMKEYLKKTHQD